MFDFTPLDVSTLMQLLDVSAVLLMLILVFTFAYWCYFLLEVFRDWWQERHHGR